MSVLDPAPEPAEFVTSREAAAILLMNEQTFNAQVRTGKIALAPAWGPSKPGRGSMYRREEVIACLEQEKKFKQNKAYQYGTEETTVQKLSVITIPQVMDKTEDYVDAEEASRILGIKKSSFYVNNATGKIPFRCVGMQKVNHVGRAVNLYRRVEVETFAASRKPYNRPGDSSYRESALYQQETVTQTRRSPETFSGATAAAIFSMLDEGMSQVDIVKATSITPREVEELKTQWAKMKDGIFIDAHSKRAIEEFFRNILPIPNFKAIVSGKELVHCLRQLENRYVTIEEARKKGLCKTCVNRYEISPKDAVICASCARKKFDVTDEEALSWKKKEGNSK